MNSDLSNKLFKLACKANLCTQFRSEWDYSSIEELITLYKANANWCMERGYPSMDLMRQYFDNDEVRNMGVYVDKDVTGLVLTEQVYLFLNCTGSVRVEFDRAKMVFPMLYLSEGSDMSVVIDGCSTPIELFSGSVVDVGCENGGSVQIFENEMVEVGV